MSLFFTIRQFLYWLFLLSSIIPIFQSLLIIALIMNNTITCAMKCEAWTWYLPSHLVPAKILCSRCEPCTNYFWSIFFRLVLLPMSLLWKMFICLFRVFRPTRYLETSPLKGCALHSWPLSSEGSLTFHTYCNTGHQFIMVISVDPRHSHLLPSVRKRSSHYLF